MILLAFKFAFLSWDKRLIYWNCNNTGYIRGALLHMKIILISLQAFNFLL